MDHLADRATYKLQNNSYQILSWNTNRGFKINKTKASHVTFSLTKDTCQIVQFNDTIIPQSTDFKFMEMLSDTH